MLPSGAVSGKIFQAGKKTTMEVRRYMHALNLDDRKYIGKVLAVAGVAAIIGSLTVAWPALSHIGLNLVS